MATKGFTYDYAQPADYAFCQDSVLAPLEIAGDLEKNLPELFGSAQGTSPELVHFRALDVCAGCGVMGFELSHALPDIQNFDFLEIQEAFADSFYKNLQIVNRSPERYRWLQKPYAVLREPGYQGHYDLIVSNPPYFQKDEGTPTANEVKQRARFFMDDSFESLLKGIRNALKPQGRAYLLMKSGKKHGRDAFTLARTELFDCEVTKLADIRGTDLIRIISPS